MMLTALEKITQSLFIDRDAITRTVSGIENTAIDFIAVIHFKLSFKHRR